MGPTGPRDQWGLVWLSFAEGWNMNMFTLAEFDDLFLFGFSHFICC